MLILTGCVAPDRMFPAHRIVSLSLSSPDCDGCIVSIVFVGGRVEHYVAANEPHEIRFTVRSWDRIERVYLRRDQCIAVVARNVRVDDLDLTQISLVAGDQERRGSCTESP